MEVNIPSSNIQHISLLKDIGLCTRCSESALYSIYNKAGLLWRIQYLCEKCLEKEIGWLRLAKVKVELSCAV